MTSDGVVYAGPGLIIRHRHFADGPCPDLVVVTFSDMFDRGAAEPELAFAWGWLGKHRVSQISVCAETADWFQESDFPSAMAAVKVRIAAQGYRRTSLYGLSMGGFGAVLAAPILRPGFILAAAPQFSVDPKVVPWERRFNAEVARIAAFPWAVTAGAGAGACLLFDPLKRPDRRHALLFGRPPGLNWLPVHGGRHNVIRFLVDRGAAPALLTQLTQQAGPAALRQAIRALRRRDGLWRRKMDKALGVGRVAAIMAACARVATQRRGGKT